MGLTRWHEFFLLIGTAGVTLTGLLFVVVSLGPRVIANQQATGVRAFMSPNAVFFTTTLVVSAVLLVPDLPAKIIGSFLCLGSIASLGYLVYTRAHQQWRQDRKSTRLNSSHRTISYAVFCLKKKKKNKTQTIK